MSTGPINLIDYLKKEQVYGAQAMLADNYRDIIQYYGIPIQYFRQNNTFPERVYERFENLIYEEHVPTFGTSGEFRLYLETTTDAFMLTKFGIEPDQKYIAYFMIKDFEYEFANLADQRWISGEYVLTIPISANSGVISAEFVSDDLHLSGLISSTIHIPTSGNVDGIAQAQYHNYEDYIYINPLIALPNQWDYVKKTFSSYHGPYTGTLDEQGNGVISANIHGVVIYRTVGDLESSFYKKVKPLPKDYFAIPFTDQNNEEFEITHVISRNMMPNGINPLLTQHVYACNVQRREYSHEDGLGENEPAVQEAIQHNQLLKDIQENLSDNIFEYVSGDIDLIDKAGSDRIYAGYGDVISAMPNSPVSSINPETYSGPISGMIFSFLYGSSLFTDGFDVYFARAGQVSGSSIITDAIRELSDISATYTQLRYLESDSRQLYFVNISGTSAEIPTEPIDNVYLRETMELNDVFKDTRSKYAPSGIVAPINRSSLFSDGESLYYINADKNIFQLA